MSEIRYMKRKNLEEESRIIGNYYSDLIKNYGIDCIYHKLDTSVFGDFNKIIDKNTLLRHAYGQNSSPDYTCSALMITYPEVHQDIFNMQKYGYVPQAEVDFNFDAKQFACDLASKCGQLKEYKIKDIDVVYELPPNDMPGAFPCKIDFGCPQPFECGVLDGLLSVELSAYEYDIEYETLCDPYQHTQFKVSFPKNNDLYASLQYEICNDSYIQSLIFLKYSVTKVKTGQDSFKSILKGKISGSILFYDINAIGKYVELIHPEVGDIITIDFPDDKNREMYEITDCYDKSLQQDGISPLLHKYIWKCKAKRYANSYEDSIETNEADDHLEEKLKYDQVVSEEVAESISMYDEGDEEAYGGYHGVIGRYDKQRIDVHKAYKYDYIHDDQCLDIMRFGTGSRLITNGYDLIFVTATRGERPGDGFIVATSSDGKDRSEAMFECGLRWLKASKEKIVFINIEGERFTLAHDEIATEDQLQLCLNDLNDKAIDVKNINKSYDNFIKFKESKTLLWATSEHLFAKLQSNGKLYKLT